MRILITGVNQPLGGLTASALRQEHELRLTGASPRPLVHSLSELPYFPADLRVPEQVEPLVEGMDAVLHLAPYGSASSADPRTEGGLLDLVARGTYVLEHACVKAGVGRVVLASRLELLDAYPPEYVINEQWRPRPKAEAASLAPYLAELTLREFARQEPLVTVCLRFGRIGEVGLAPQDAVEAIRKALTMDLTGRNRRWWLFHVSGDPRFPSTAAEGAPLEFSRRAG
jgi:nucleoside-diphosphate-sugar epimerase